MALRHDRPQQSPTVKQTGLTLADNEFLALYPAEEEIETYQDVVDHVRYEFPGLLKTVEDVIELHRFDFTEDDSLRLIAVTLPSTHVNDAAALGEPVKYRDVGALSVDFDENPGLLETVTFHPNDGSESLKYRLLDVCNGIPVSEVELATGIRDAFRRERLRRAIVTEIEELFSHTFSSVAGVVHATHTHIVVIDPEPLLDLYIAAQSKGDCLDLADMVFHKLKANLPKGGENECMAAELIDSANYRAMVFVAKYVPKDDCK